MVVRECPAIEVETRGNGKPTKISAKNHHDDAGSHTTHPESLSRSGFVSCPRFVTIILSVVVGENRSDRGGDGPSETRLGRLMVQVEEVYKVIISRAGGMG